MTFVLVSKLNLDQWSDLPQLIKMDSEFIEQKKHNLPMLDEQEVYSVVDVAYYTPVWGFKPQ